MGELSLVLVEGVEAIRVQFKRCCDMQ